MTIKSRWVSAVALAVLAIGGLLAGTALDAQGPGGPRGDRSFGWRGGPGHGMHLLREIGLGRLDLSDAQEEQIRSIGQTHRNELTQLGERRRTAHQALNDVVISSTFDEAAIRARSAEVASVQADAAVVRAKIRGEVWSILTAEQQQKATERRAKMAERFRQRQEQRNQQ